MKIGQKISVITITYNSSGVIEKYIKSLIRSKLKIAELIIIENNSRDKDITKNICLRYKSKINLRYQSGLNNGFGKSCNIGARIANGNTLLFLNPDTEVQSNSLGVLAQHMQLCDADLIGGKSQNYAGETHLTVVRKPNLNIGLFEFSNLGKIFRTEAGHRDFYYLDKNSVINAKKDITVDALGGAYLMIKKSAFTTIGGFDEKFFMYLEDVDLSVRANELGMKVYYCPHSVISHIGGASSDNKYKIRHQAWFDSRKYYFRKHFNMVVNMLIQPLYIIEEYLLKLIKKI